MIEKKVGDLLCKGAITLIDHIMKDKFLSTLFLVTKNDGNQRPVINLKQMNQFIPYPQFKMDGSHYLKKISRERDYM